jgi:hypothetical protein
MHCLAGRRTKSYDDINHGRDTIHHVRAVAEDGRSGKADAPPSASAPVLYVSNQSPRLRAARRTERRRQIPGRPVTEPLPVREAVIRLAFPRLNARPCLVKVKPVRVGLDLVALAGQAPGRAGRDSYDPIIISADRAWAAESRCAAHVLAVDR